MRLFKVNNVSLYASFEKRNGEIISLSNSCFNLNTGHNIKLCGYYKINVDFKIKNTELVKTYALRVYVSFYDFNPRLVCILHHLGVFFRDVVTGVVLFLAVDLFIDVIVKLKELLQFLSDILCLFLVGITLTNVIQIEVGEEAIVVLFFFLFLAIACVNLRNYANACISTNINVSVHFIVGDIWENPSCFPNCAAFHVQGKKDFLLENCLGRYNNLILSILSQGKLYFKGKGKLNANTVGLLKVLKHTLANLNIRLCLAFSNLIVKSATCGGACLCIHPWSIFNSCAVRHCFKPVC